jgi:SAM-dependent methyltransferase
MNPELVSILRCPVTGASLSLVAAAISKDGIVSGELVSEDGSRRYPIVDSIPRFVTGSNYADTFGVQWNRFRQTQLDSHSGVRISRDRFFASTGWTPGELKHRRVLDVGCGAGRFVEIALEAGAYVVAVDYSSAVEACWANHGPHPRLSVVQGDIYRLPLKEAAFDYVYCLGVLQHTPDVRSAFMSLPPMLKPGGRLAVDVYPQLPLNLVWPKYWLRPILRRLPPQRLLPLIEAVVPLLLPVSRFLGAVPLLGRKLRHAVPVANYEGVYPLSPGQLHEWAVLDTFDMFSARYDRPQTARTVREWLRQAKLEDVWVGRVGALVGRGRKPIDT